MGFATFYQLALREQQPHFKGLYFVLLRKNFLFSFALESTNRYPFLDLKATFIRAKPA